MKQLWAPWRIEYILDSQKQDDGCIFCNLPQNNDDKANFILDRGEFCFTVMNLYPYNNGHLLIAPYRHIACFEEISSEENREIFEHLQKWTKIIKNKFKPHGFNLGMNLGRVAGAGVDSHLHYHLVPRWNGDTSFISILSDTKVINQCLIKCFKILKKGEEELKNEPK